MLIYLKPTSKFFKFILIINFVMILDFAVNINHYTVYILSFFFYNVAVLLRNIALVYVLALTNYTLYIKVNLRLFYTMKIIQTRRMNMSIPPNHYPQNFKEDIFVNFCSDEYASHEETGHFHDNHYELCFVLKGSFNYYFDLKKRTVTSGNVILINRKVSHFSTDKSNGTGERIIINFTDNYLRSLSLTSFFLDEIFSDPLLNLSHDFENIFRHLLTELVYESDYPSRFSPNLIRGSFYRLIVTLYRIATNTQTQKELPPNPIVEMASKYICRNFSSDITLDKLSKVCNVSKYHLSRLFKSEKNETIISYLTSIRIEKASELLTGSEKSIMEISQICGFNSHNHFCEIFKLKKGISPREFRNNR